MPQSLSKAVIHTVFSTKRREPLLADQDLRGEVHAYLGGVGEKLGCHPIRVGGTSDHVHLLTTLSRTITIADFVKETKRISSGWIKERGSTYSGFHWQAGYGVFSVSQSEADVLIKYVQNQEEHHKRITFQEEFRRICERHGIVIDERYVWG